MKVEQQPKIIHDIPDTKRRNTRSSEIETFSHLDCTFTRTIQYTFIYIETSIRMNPSFRPTKGCLFQQN